MKKNINNQESLHSNTSIIRLLYRLYKHISPRRRRQLFLLLILMVVSSFAEVVSIGAVLPFLGVLTSPESVYESVYAQGFISLFGISTPDQLIMPLTVIFATAAVVAGMIRLLLLWVNTRLSFSTGADLSFNIYQRSLCQPYITHIERNSSEIINTISTKSNIVIYDIILPIFTLVSSMIMLSVILVAMLIINPVAMLIATSSFGLIYIVIVQLTSSRLKSNSKITALKSTKIIKTLQESLGAIREVLIDGNQSYYCQKYKDSDYMMRKAQAHNAFIGLSPRYVMEALGMVVFAILAYTLIQQENGSNNVIPVLGALALGAQRMLPMLQQSYQSWSSINGGQASLNDVLTLLDQQVPDINSNQEIIFENNISLNDVSYRYNSQSPWILFKNNLTIVKGSKIGIIGTTGSGKSTFVDIIMGLIDPKEGNISIDGIPVTALNKRSWQNHIAHVPQEIFLSDQTIEENIAFGVDKELIDLERVKNAAFQAQISNFIEGLPRKYHTKVGERGARLSGGQIQRIGIARAIYKQASIIVFDEATSALDVHTEKSVMDTIESISDNLTIFIIAHRTDILKNCTHIIKLEDANIKQFQNIQEVKLWKK